MPTSVAHTVRAFDHDIDELRTLIGEMGALAEALLTDAVQVLMDRNAAAAADIAARDRQIDQMETEAERRAVTIIALRGPLADDLREIIAALKISNIVERIGDYAKNIAKRVPTLAQMAPVAPMLIIPEMTRLAASMVRDALDAYARRDAELALDVTNRDQQVDEYYNSLFRKLLTYMMENTHLISASAHLLFIAKNLERIGDHATNIAEMVYFSVTGERVLDRAKSDETASIAPRIDE